MFSCDKTAVVAEVKVFLVYMSKGAQQPEFCHVTQFESNLNWRLASRFSYPHHKADDFAGLTNTLGCIWLSLKEGQVQLLVEDCILWFMTLKPQIIAES